MRFSCPGPCPVKHGPDAQKERKKKSKFKRRSAGLRVPNSQTGAPHRGKTKADSGLTRRILFRKTKCADFKMKSAAKTLTEQLCQAQPGNRSPLHIPCAFRKRGNTDLLTCVRERNAPAFTACLLTDHLCNDGLSSRRIAPLRRDLARTAPFRVGLATFFCLPILPAGVRNRRVLRYLNIQFYRRKSSVGTYGREGAPLHDDFFILFIIIYDFSPFGKDIFRDAGSAGAAFRQIRPRGM